MTARKENGVIYEVEELKGNIIRIIMTARRMTSLKNNEKDGIISRMTARKENDVKKVEESKKPSS